MGGHDRREPDELAGAGGHDDGASAKPALIQKYNTWEAPLDCQDWTRSSTMISTMNVRCSLCLSVALAVAWTTSACSKVAAQSSTMATTYSLQAKPAVSEAELRIIVRVLRLPEDSRKAMDDLYGAYSSTLQSEAADLRATMDADIERAQILNNSDELASLRTRMVEWKRRSDQLKSSFLSDLRSLLTKEQDGSWALVERELRRFQRVGAGRLAGESLDLVRLTEELIEDVPTGQLADTLEQYSTELDSTMTARDRFISEQQKAFEDALQAPEAQAERANELWMDALRLRKAVRDVNDRFIRSISTHLPTERQTAFRSRILEASYRPLLHASLAETSLENALGLATLSPEQKLRLEQLKTSYAKDKLKLLETGGPAWRLFEEDNRPAKLAAAMKLQPAGKTESMYNGSWLADSHPLIQFRKQRLALDRALRAAVDEVLSPEQRRLGRGQQGHIVAQFESWESSGL